MKKIFFLILLFSLFTNCINSQTSDVGPYSGINEALALDLKGTTLMVAIDESNQAQTIIIKESLKKYWKHNEYKFIRVGEEQQYLKNSNYSVLCIITSMYEGGTVAQSYWYSIVLGNNAYKEAKDARIVTQIGLPDTYEKKTGRQLANYDYLIPFFIKSLNMRVDKALAQVEIKGTEKKGAAWYYGDGYNILRNKKILINKDVVGEDFKIKGFCKNFGFKESQVFIVDKEDISKAIMKEDSEVAFIYDLPRNVATIFDAKTSESLGYAAGKSLMANRVIMYGISIIGLIGLIVLSIYV